MGEAPEGPVIPAIVGHIDGPAGSNVKDSR